MRVVGKRAIVQEIKQETTQSGIYLDDESMKQHNKNSKRATVISSNIEGVAVGDTIVMSRYYGTPFTYKGQDYLLMDEKDIEGVID